jgi:hypothetical protein
MSIKRKTNRIYVYMCNAHCKDDVMYNKLSYCKTVLDEIRLKFYSGHRHQQAHILTRQEYE